MRVLFYIEPITERDTPTWKAPWIHFVNMMATSIRQDSPNAEFCCVVGDGLEDVAKSALQDCHIAVLHHTELVPRFGANALAATIGWYNTPAADALVEMAALIKARMPHEASQPDACITFSSAPFLSTAFPGIPILHFELGLVSRNPFPETAYLDPLGMFNNSYPIKYRHKIRAYTATAQERALLNGFRATYLPLITANNPIAKHIKPITARYDSCILLCLQFSQYYGYDAHATYPDQYDLLIQTLTSAPPNIGVIVVEHPQFPIMKEETFQYLGKKYPNFIWMKQFRELPSASQYLIEYVDLVVTVSSSVGLQTLIWKKPLIVLGHSHLDVIADAHSLEDIQKVIGQTWPNYKENVLAWHLSRYNIPFNLLYQNGALIRRIHLAQHCAVHGDYEPYFEHAFADIGEIAKAYSIELHMGNPKEMELPGPECPQLDHISGNIESTSKKQIMEFTGERFVPSEQGQIRLEHYHRYAMVLDLVTGKDVLDLACGEGYGSRLMANSARSVIGVDISHEAVQHASSAYAAQRTNLSYRQGQAPNLDFADGSFDIVISFETIEHLMEQEQMLAEIRRVLKADGILIISSPNRPVYSGENNDVNHFHVRELDFDEFDTLLKTQFPAIRYCGQRMAIGSLIKPFTGDATHFQAWHDDGVSLWSGTGQPLSDPVYFVATCAASEDLLPNMEPSALYPTSADLVKHYVGFAKWAQSMGDTLATNNAQITNLNQALEERDRQLSEITSDYQNKIHNLATALHDENDQIAALKQALADREQQITSLSNSVLEQQQWALSLDAELRNERANLLTIIRSHSWRATLPLRELSRWASSPTQQTKKYAKASLKLAKRAYQSLPLSYQTKAAHRRLLAKVMPRILLASGIPRLSPQLPASNRSASLEMAERALVSADLSAIRLTPPDTPLVSVIVPIYGKLDYTLRCLASIVLNPPLAPFEVIVVDDCSPDNSVEILAKVQGIRLICNNQNQGFIRSCNIGAKEALGEYVYFLNNDTEVTDGWLDALVRTFQDFPGTGLAGSKLIYPDGRLQEAGGIIWQDGSAWNFGRLQDPLLPIYNYAREVDYCSGASIMVPKSLFDELGGFDEHYIPAYCEDSDLALKIRNEKYRVIYQPASTVIHYEGVTSGTDTTQGVKAYQVKNAIKLYERWKDRLKAHQRPGIDPDRAKDRRATRRVLVMDHCTPTPDQDAGSITVFNLLLLLREMDFQVTFIPEDNLLYMPEYTAALQHKGIEVLYAPYVTSVEQHLKEFGGRYDMAFLFRPGVVERQLTNIRKFCPEAKLLYHTVDLHYLRMSREAELRNDGALYKAATDMKSRELAAIRASDASIIHSTTELELLRQELSSEKLHVFPLIMDVEKSNKGFSERRDIAFIGGYQHTPNVDAVLYFVSEIMPLVRTQLPGARFYIVGSKPPAELQALACDDVIVTGFIDDLNAFLATIRVSVAPLRFGAGIKGKIGSAMAVGLPVVATSIATEGMLLTNDENILVADSPEAFAAAISTLYKEQQTWDRLSEAGLQFASTHWGAEAAWSTLATILADLDITAQRDSWPLRLVSTSEPVVADNKVNDPLQPAFVARNCQEYEKGLAGPALQQIKYAEQKLIKDADSERFLVDGFCEPCGRSMPLLVDMQSGGARIENQWAPNWRERLECPACQMNNRQRLIAGLLKREAGRHVRANIYLMEQVTPIYRWVTEKLQHHHLIGSEYLGHDYKSGDVINGIRHEDVMHLSFSDNSLDLIISNDVFEHIPNPAEALKECARVLRPGGTMLATIPFYTSRHKSVVRAEICENGLNHLLPAQYHGNPVSAEGSLVFTDFGWDLLDSFLGAGFSDAAVEVYASEQHGHLGGGQLIFRLSK